MKTWGKENGGRAGRTRPGSSVMTAAVPLIANLSPTKETAHVHHLCAKVFGAAKCLIELHKSENSEDVSPRS